MAEKHKQFIERIKKQTSIMKEALKHTTIEEPGFRKILENGLRIIEKELDKITGNLVFVDFKVERHFDKPAGKWLYYVYGIHRGGKKKWMGCRPTKADTIPDIKRLKSYDWYQP